MEPKTLVGGYIPPIPPLDPPLASYTRVTNNNRNFEPKSNNCTTNFLGYFFEGGGGTARSPPPSAATVHRLSRHLIRYLSILFCLLVVLPLIKIR